jgi:hypothetical protein
MVVINHFQINDVFRFIAIVIASKLAKINKLRVLTFDFSFVHLFKVYVSLFLRDGMVFQNFVKNVYYLSFIEI